MSWVIGDPFLQIVIQTDFPVWVYLSQINLVICLSFLAAHCMYHLSIIVPVVCVLLVF